MALLQDFILLLIRQLSRLNIKAKYILNFNLSALARAAGFARIEVMRGPEPVRARGRIARRRRSGRFGIARPVRAPACRGR
jgi:hypothetical protein